MNVLLHVTWLIIAFHGAKQTVQEWPDPPFPVLVMQYIQRWGKGVVWFTRLVCAAARGYGSFFANIREATSYNR